MGLKVRIGVSLIARFRNRYVHFIWTPRGFSDARDFLAFLKSEKMVDLLAEGKEVSCCQQQYVLKVLDRFNSNHSIAIKERYGVSMSPPTFQNNGCARSLWYMPHERQKLQPV